MSEPTAFIIHLARSLQRLPQVEQLRAALPCPSEIFPACDGSALTEAQVDQVYRRRLHAPFYPFALNRGEIGVFLSHRAVWREIVARGLDHALVFEDDAALDAAQFARTMALAAQSRQNWSYALAPSEKTFVRGATLAKGDQVALIRPENPPLRAIAQFVSREAAQKLLAATEVFDRPVDTFLQMSWVTGVELLALQPSGVRDGSGALGGSTIQPRKKPLAQRFARETLRPIYRMQVRLWHKFAKRPA